MRIMSNERVEAVWLLSNWAPLHHGTQDRQDKGHKGHSLQGLLTPPLAWEQREEQRAAVMMDEGAAGRLQ